MVLAKISLTSINNIITKGKENGKLLKLKRSLGSRISGFRGTSEVTKNNKESKRLLERIIAKMRILNSFEKSSKY